MLFSQINILFVSKADGKRIVGPVTLQFDSLEAYNAATDEDKLDMLRREGFDVIRIIQPDENVVGVYFGEWDN